MLLDGANDGVTTKFAVRVPLLPSTTVTSATAIVGVFATVGERIAATRAAVLVSERAASDDPATPHGRDWQRVSAGLENTLTFTCGPSEYAITVAKPVLPVVRR